MNKPYLLFRNHYSPYWYAQIRLADGSLSNNKSTGKESRTEAEKVVRNVIEVGRKTHRDVIWHCWCGRMELWKIWEFVVEYKEKEERICQT